MSTIRVAIIGSGNIGADLMFKVMRLLKVHEMDAALGIVPASDSLARAQHMDDACSGRASAIFKQRDRIKRQTIERWRLKCCRLAPQHQTKDAACTPLNQAAIYAKCSDDGQESWNC